MARSNSQNRQHPTEQHPLLCWKQHFTWSTQDFCHLNSHALGERTHRETAQLFSGCRALTELGNRQAFTSPLKSQSSHLQGKQNHSPLQSQDILRFLSLSNMEKRRWYTMCIISEKAGFCHFRVHHPEKPAPLTFWTSFCVLVQPVKQHWRVQRRHSKNKRKEEQWNY